MGRPRLIVLLLQPRYLNHQGLKLKNLIYFSYQDKCAQLNNICYLEISLDLVSGVQDILGNISGYKLMLFLSFISGSGSSSNACSDTYHGGSALSEPETKALDTAVKNTPNVVAFISLHSYSQYILLPWGYTTTKPSDYTTLVSID